MARCQYTPDRCTKGYCGEHGTCKSIVDELSCECELGYTGDRCEIDLKAKFSKRLGAASFSGLILALGAFLIRMTRAILPLIRLDMTVEDVSLATVILWSSLVAGPTEHSSKTAILLYLCRRFSCPSLLESNTFRNQSKRLSVQFHRDSLRIPHGLDQYYSCCNLFVQQWSNGFWKRGM